jgi:hypothetical protein
MIDSLVAYLFKAESPAFILILLLSTPLSTDEAIKQFRETLNPFGISTFCPISVTPP